MIVWWFFLFTRGKPLKVKVTKKIQHDIEFMGEQIAMCICIILTGIQFLLTVCQYLNLCLDRHFFLENL